MKRFIQLSSIIFISIIFLVSCNDESPTGSGNKETCGEGEGYPVEFCRQVGNYEAGYGVSGEDTIIVNCIVGPKGATVSNTKNGTYYCSGTYKLSTFSFGEISFNFGGSTQYDIYDEHTISSAGEGTFSVKVKKTSGGSGNIFLSMASGSSWMFDIVLINIDCDGGVAGLSKVKTIDSASLVRHKSYTEKKVPMNYYQNN